MCLVYSDISLCVVFCIVGKVCGVFSSKSLPCSARLPSFHEVNGFSWGMGLEMKQSGGT